MIDWNNRIITGSSGKVYKIQPELISAGRAPEFEIRGMVLGYRTNLDTLAALHSNVKLTLIKGEDNMAGNIHKVLNLLDDFDKGILHYLENKRNALLEFASLFCIAEGEDVGIHNEEIIRDKYNDWKHIPDQDFFFLCQKAIPSFAKRYLETEKAVNQKSV
jgi:hypothetical protein